MAYRHSIIVQRVKGRKKPFLVRWKGEFNFQTGAYKKPSKSFLRKKDAEIFAEKLQDDLDRGTNPCDNSTIGEFCEKFLKFKKNEVLYSSWQLYERAVKELLKYFHSTVPIKMITQEKAEEFLNQIGYIDPNYKKKGGNIADFTKHQYLRLCRTTFRKAVKWEYIQKNPFVDIKIGKVSKKAWYYIQPEDFKAIMNVIDNLPIPKRNYDKYIIRKKRLKAFYSIMYGCGLRFGEAANLLWNDQNLDLDNGMVNIVNRDGSKDMPAYNIKDYEARSIRMPQFVIQAIQDLKNVDENSSPFVFLNEEQWTRVLGRWHLFSDTGKEEKWDSKELMGSALKTFKRYCDKAGIKTHKKLNLHSLRKGYGSNMHKHCPPQTLKELMGHSSIVTTMEYYVQDTDENKIQAVKALDRMME